MRKNVMVGMLMMGLMFCGTKGYGQITSNSSVSATGTVFDKYNVLGVPHLKIERSDGSKLAASCDSGFPVDAECEGASIGETAWGRASCFMGVCEWGCLDVIHDCSPSEIDSFYLTGTVIEKSFCAGNVYMTILRNGSEIYGFCPGSTCNGVDVQDSMSGFLDVGCGNSEWRDVSGS